MSNLLIPASFAISVVRHTDDEGQHHYNALIELNTDENAVLLATEIFSADLYDCCLEAVSSAIRFCGEYADDIYLFECDGTPINERAPFAVTDLVEALEDPDTFEIPSERILH